MTKMSLRQVKKYLFFSSLFPNTTYILHYNSKKYISPISPALLYYFLVLLLSPEPMQNLMLSRHFIPKFKKKKLVKLITYIPNRG